ncbi:hypothetical protein LBMAG42_37850 [Deltaproteobacteria bacterium]|nr:hypothetical protein LBMAG42_37850 [Deltaproteobacteria bacterium]
MLFLLIHAALAQEPAPFPEWTLPAATVEAVRAVAGRPLGERLDAATRGFLGRPYVVDIAGEGEGVDPDAPARYDTFDCMTFLEEALGMALAGDPLQAPLIRDALRYSGAPTYLNRNHFMEAEWIPRAIAAGLLEDVTDRVGRARTLTKDVSRDTWRAWGARMRVFRELPDTRLPVGSWSMRYLDLAEAAEAASRIPPGAIVVTLRVARTWSPVITTHVSLVVPGPHEPMMRHATKMGQRQVRDDKLSWYMTHLRDYVNWPALGVAILMPVEQGPTVAATLPDGLPPLRFADAEGELPHFDPKPLVAGARGEDPT